MRRALTCWILSIAIALFLRIDKISGDLQPTPNMDAVNRFSFEILKRKLSENSGENIVYSTFSIARALSLIYTGSDGETKAQIGSTLGWNNNEASSLQSLNENMKMLNDGKSTKIAEHVWVDENIKILDSYAKEVGNLGVASFSIYPKEELTRINNWIENNTDHEIKDFFPEGSINDLTRLVLVNTVLFKGLWKNPFKKENTRSGIFHCENGEDTAVDYMFRNGDFRSIQDENFEMVEIPYESDEFSFIATLPKEGLKIIDFVKGFESNTLYQKIEQFNEARAFTLDVYIPRFKVSEKTDLKEMLPALGIKDMFLANKADFSKMTGDKSLFCSSAFHQASVEVNEEGTKASAASGFGMALMSLPPSIRFDRPFMIHIVHKKSKMVLFSGVIKKFT